EEPAELVEVGRVEGGDAAFDLEAGPLHALRVACRDDHLGSLRVGPPRRLEADPGAPADDQERLSGELLTALRHAASIPVAGGSMATARNVRSSLARVV